MIRELMQIEKYYVLRFYLYCVPYSFAYFYVKTLIFLKIPFYLINTRGSIPKIVETLWKLPFKIFYIILLPPHYFFVLISYVSGAVWISILIQLSMIELLYIAMYLAINKVSHRCSYAHTRHSYLNLLKI